jgi:hypothetical protein
MRFETIDGLGHALFEETGDAMFLFDPETDQVLDANSTAQRLSGFSVREILRLTVKELFRATSEEGGRHLEKAARNSAVVFCEEGFFLRAAKESEGIPVHLTISRLHVRPRTLGLITARDVRRQHEAFHRLRIMEAELRRVLASVSDCFWSAEIDDKGKCIYLYFSPQVESVAGLPAAFFLVGVHRWWSVVHPEDQPRWTKAMARQRAGQPTEEEYRVVWPNGSHRWVRERVQVSRGTAERGLLRLDGVIADISDQKDSARAVQDCEERFNRLLDHGPALAFIKDADGRYCFVSRPLQSFLQRNIDEILRRRDEDLYPADVAARLRENDRRAMASTTPIQSVDRVVGPDGGSRSWFVSRCCFKDSSGRRLLGGLIIDVDSVQAAIAYGHGMMNSVSAPSA